MTSYQNLVYVPTAILAAATTAALCGFLPHDADGCVGNGNVSTLQ